jgi:hypothetical protein
MVYTSYTLDVAITGSILLVECNEAGLGRTRNQKVAVRALRIAACEASEASIHEKHAEARASRRLWYFVALSL